MADRSNSQVLYSPALRMKMGELCGLRELEEGIADHVLPRLIVPPLAERNDQQIEMFLSGKVPDIGAAISPYWRGRQVFIDGTYLLQEDGKLTLDDWYPSMFARARYTGVAAIPMSMLQNITEGNAAAYKNSINKKAVLKFGICVLSGDLVAADVATRIKLALELLGLSAQECCVIADFSDSDFSDANVVRPIIRRSLEFLHEIAPWKHIIFQGTHYPEKNPAQPGTHAVCERNEWIAWKAAVGFDAQTANYLIFGDYAADCAKMEFGGSGGRPITHYRYAAESSWHVERGGSGKDEDQMRAVCKKLIAQRCFAGEDFSRADRYIHNTAIGLDGPGNAATWRQVNTTHHITRVVVDVGSVKGIRFSRLAPQNRNDQMTFLT